MNNISFDAYQAIDESMDNIYEWTVDDIKLPFYVYQQYIFDVGSITFAIRFTRTFIVGVKSMRTSYVMIGKKMNKKLSTKMPPLPNPKKFIATVTDIIKYHLETFPKANRGIVLRFDEKTFERVEKLFHLIVRLKLKTAYKYSEEFTWSPTEGSRCFYVWKKQFTFKSLYSNFIKAAEKQAVEQQDDLVANDFVDTDDDLDFVYSTPATDTKPSTPVKNKTNMKDILKQLKSNSVVEPDWGYPEDESGGDDDDDDLHPILIKSIMNYGISELELNQMGVKIPVGYVWNKNNNFKSYKSEDGKNWEKYAYDGADNLIFTLRNDGSWDYHTYDSDGSLLHTKNQSGLTYSPSGVTVSTNQNADDEPLMKVTVVDDDEVVDIKSTLGIDLSKYTLTQLGNTSIIPELHLTLVFPALNEVMRYTYVEDSDLEFQVYKVWVYNYENHKTLAVNLLEPEFVAFLLSKKENSKMDEIPINSDEHVRLGFNLKYDSGEMNKTNIYIRVNSTDTLIYDNNNGSIVKTLVSPPDSGIIAISSPRVWFSIPRRFIAGNAKNAVIYFVDHFKNSGKLPLYKTEGSVPTSKPTGITRVVFSIAKQGVWLNQLLSLNSSFYGEDDIDTLAPAKKKAANKVKPKVAVEINDLTKLSKKRFDLDSGEHAMFMENNTKFSVEIGPFEFSYTDDIAQIVKKLRSLQEYIKDDFKRKHIKEMVDDNLRNNLSIGNKKYLDFAESIHEVNPISDSTKDAIKAYTGSVYQSVNRILRGFKDPVTDSFGEMDHATKVMQALDKAFVTDSVYLNGFKSSVYRGQSVEEVMIDSIVQNKEYTTNSFYSTSTNIGTAFSFLKYEGSLKDEGSTSYSNLPSEGRIANLMAIKDIHRIPVIVPGKHSSHTTENEVILPRGTNLKLVNWEMIERPALWSENKTRKLFVTTYSCVGVGGEASQIVESKAHMIMEMIEANQESENTAKYLLVLDTMLDIAGIGAVFPGMSNEALLDEIEKWTTE